MSCGVCVLAVSGFLPPFHIVEVNKISYLSRDRCIILSASEMSRPVKNFDKSVFEPN